MELPASLVSVEPLLCMESSTFAGWRDTALAGPLWGSPGSLWGSRVSRGRSAARHRLGRGARVRRQGPERLRDPAADRPCTLALRRLVSAAVQGIHGGRGCDEGSRFFNSRRGCDRSRAAWRIDGVRGDADRRLPVPGHEGVVRPRARSDGRQRPGDLSSRRASWGRRARCSPSLRAPACR